MIGRVLLGEAAKITRGAKPRALVVAPTRELAAQVQRELGWLFAHSGGRIAAFTGGTDLRGDARALRTGVDVVVGTPGRLVDLIERKTLDLSAVEVVVLDEADEMLDLGFREALETLLEATPAERRTLLFSATLPPAIRALAKRFQKDAVAIDPRSGPPTAHEDIRHVAHLCADGERLAALVNVLRLADDERAIVFCRTRDNVAELHADLTARGFRRHRDLGRPRAGRAHARARGAAPRARARAGRHQRRRARARSARRRPGRARRSARERRGAHPSLGPHRPRRQQGRQPVHRRARRAPSRRAAVPRRAPAAGWTAPPDAPPSPRTIARACRPTSPAAIGSAREPELTALAEKLVADHDAVAVVALLLERALAGRPAGEKLSRVELRPTPSASAAHRTQCAARGAPSSGDMVLFEVNLGAKDGAEANWILPLVCQRGAITRREVGAIRVARDRTYFEIARARGRTSSPPTPPSAIRARRTCASSPRRARCRSARSPHPRAHPPRVRPQAPASSAAVLTAMVRRTAIARRPKAALVADRDRITPTNGAAAAPRAAPPEVRRDARGGRRRRNAPSPTASRRGRCSHRSRAGPDSSRSP